MSEIEIAKARAMASGPMAYLKVTKGEDGQMSGFEVKAAIPVTAPQAELLGRVCEFFQCDLALFARYAMEQLMAMADEYMHDPEFEGTSGADLAVLLHERVLQSYQYEPIGSDGEE